MKLPSALHPNKTNMISQEVSSKINLDESQDTLPSQFDFARCFTGLKSSLRDTDSTSLAKLDLIFVIGVCTWAMMREMNASKGTGTEILVALYCKRKTC
jgi:hypothetical protein